MQSRARQIFTMKMIIRFCNVSRNSHYDFNWDITGLFCAKHTTTTRSSTYVGTEYDTMRMRTVRLLYHRARRNFVSTFVSSARILDSETENNVVAGSTIRYTSRIGLYYCSRIYFVPYFTINEIPVRVPVSMHDTCNSFVLCWIRLKTPEWDRESRIRPIETHVWKCTMVLIGKI
jgi:hypothetical protein